MGWEIREPARNDSGGIDCEVNHPDLGWIPFTAHQSDPEEHGRELFARLDGMDQSSFGAVNGG